MNARKPPPRATLTVGELIQQLSTCSMDAEVWAFDSEVRKIARIGPKAHMSITDVVDGGDRVIVGVVER